MKLTAIIEKGENGWYVGQLEEIPAVISQGRTIEELRSNLLDALQLVLETQRELTQKEYEGRDFIKEDFLHMHF
jgi:predicted RNase H-like HicB family nuclease